MTIQYQSICIFRLYPLLADLFYETKFHCGIQQHFCGNSLQLDRVRSQPNRIIESIINLNGSHIKLAQFFDEVFTFLNQKFNTMKKQIFLSAILLSACSLVASAQTQPASDAVKTENAAQERTEVKAENLPDPIKKTLAGDEYKGWEISKAYVAKEIYEVELKKGTETKTFKFDKEGKLVK